MRIKNNFSIFIVNKNGVVKNFIDDNNLNYDKIVSYFDEESFEKIDNNNYNHFNRNYIKLGKII
jgi:uncharacterized Fe-S cluster-containing radical SAM superfamily protein